MSPKRPYPHNRQLPSQLLTHTLHRLAVKDKHGVPAVLWATLNNWALLVLLLLDNGVDINLVDKDGSTALHYTVSKGHIQPIQLLFKGAKFNSRDKNGAVVLHKACSQAHTFHLCR